ncbi:MAG: hypothetical protein ABJC24_00155 [Chloroflexota bacterium]
MIDANPGGALLTDEVREKSLLKVEQDLNRLYMSTPGKEAIKRGEGVTFRVRYQTTATTPSERAKFGVLQYPVHILNGQGTNKTEPDHVVTMAKEHGISNAGRSGDIFEVVREAWEDSNVEGLGIPPWRTPQKVGFIKADNIYKRPGNRIILFRNIMLHELGHMFGQDHGDGVMKRAIVLADDSLFYTEAQQTSIRANVRGWAMRALAEEQAAERAAKAKRGP